MKEVTLHFQVAKLLEMQARDDILYWHCPNGEIRNPIVGAKLKRMGVKAGVWDWALLIKFRLHFLELKSETGRLTQVQKDWREKGEKAGAYFHVAKTLDEAIVVLQKIGALKRNIVLNSQPARINAPVLVA